MQRLEDGDLDGILPEMQQYLLLHGEELKVNPRGQEDYKERCVQSAGLGKHFDEESFVPSFGQSG